MPPHLPSHYVRLCAHTANHALQPPRFAFHSACMLHPRALRPCITCVRPHSLPIPPISPLPAPVVGVSRVIAGAHFFHDVGLGALIAGAGLYAHLGSHPWMWSPLP